MTRYKPEELGPVQKKVLKHIFCCEKRQAESVSHISRELGVLRESVHRSVKLLIKAGYVLKNDEYTLGKKEIVVTPKGAALAVVLGVATSQLVKYLDRRKRYDPSAADIARYFEGFTRMGRIKDPSKQDILVREMMEYLLNQDNYFDKVGRVAKDLSEEERRKLMEYLVIRYHQAVGKPRRIKDVADKYGLDKNSLRESLEREKASIDSLIRQLES